METDRQKKIVNISLLSISVNIIIAVLKIIIGFITSSIAITSEGLNNATDACSSFLTLIGTKLSTKHPDIKHPFGYGRIEYLTGLIIGALVFYTGISLLINSIKELFIQKSMTISYTAVMIVFITAVIKFLLGIYVIKAGKQTESQSLLAVGKEGRNDAFFSLVTIASSLLYMQMHISLDAYVGLIFSLIIIKNAVETLKETLSELIGRPGKKELATLLYKEIRSTEGILNVADMMLHNYGVGKWSGSVNIEIDHKRNIGDIYESIHALQLRIMHEYHVTLVFGIYAVNNDSSSQKELRTYIAQFIRNYDHLISYHALYQSNQTNKIYIDFVVDYDLKDWEALRVSFTEYMKQYYPEYDIVLTIETEFI